MDSVSSAFSSLTQVQDFGLLARRLEPLHQIGIRRDVLGQDIDGDRAVEAGVAGFVHLPMPPAPRAETISYGPSRTPGASAMDLPGMENGNRLDYRRV